MKNLNCILALVVSVTLFGCTDKNKTVFLSDCVEAAPKAVCECTYDRLKEKYSSDELEQINSSSSEKQPAGFSFIMQKSLNECS